MINPDQLKALGIQIQETEEGFSVTSEKALPEITKAELKYLLGSATNFVVGEVLNETNYASAQNETKIILQPEDQNIPNQNHISEPK